MVCMYEKEEIIEDYIKEKLQDIPNILDNYYDSESGGNVDFIIQKEFQSLFQQS